eukprot:1809284-Rhodomonas_salina.3
MGRWRGCQHVACDNFVHGLVVYQAPRQRREQSGVHGGGGSCTLQVIVAQIRCPSRRDNSHCVSLQSPNSASISDSHAEDGIPTQ